MLRGDHYSRDITGSNVSSGYWCNICGKEFLERVLWMQPVRRGKHGKRGRSSFNTENVCEQCGKKFRDRRDLNRPMIKHTGHGISPSCSLALSTCFWCRRATAVKRATGLADTFKPGR